MGRRKGLWLVAVLVLAPAAVAAQAPRDGAPGATGSAAASATQPAAPSSQTLQRMFAYLEPSLRIEIAGEAPGSIQVIRGENGVLEISATAPMDASPPAVARSAVDKLTLLASGAGAVQYVVVVPRDASVTVARAGQPGVNLATLDPAGRWSWPAGAAAGGELPH